MSGLQKQVADFLAEREQVIRAIEGCPASNMEDYWRWQGHAEARRVLRESLEREGVDLGATEPAPVETARDEYSDAMNLELRRSIAANVLEAMDVDQYLIDAVRNASPEPREPGVPVEKVRAQHADFLNRAKWARNHRHGEAASLWVSAADLLQYLLPEEPTS